MWMGKVEVAAGGNQRIHPKIDQETTKEGEISCAYNSISWTQTMKIAPSTATGGSTGIHKMLGINLI